MNKQFVITRTVNSLRKKAMMKPSILRLVMIALAVTVMGISSAYAGTAYTNGRAFLKEGSPTAAGKVYVASNATEPTSGQYKAVTSSTSPAFNVQVAGDATFHYWAVANAGYKFTGWYTANGSLVSSGAAHINSGKVSAGQAGSSDTHAYADYYASFVKIVQLSFIVPTNGTFDISHNGADVANYASFTTDGKVVLTAHPADGYKLRGWYTSTNGGATKNYFAFGNSCEPNFTDNKTIGAEFVPDDGKATFWIKGTNKIFDDLNAANTAASSGNIIVVVSDGMVGAGTYSIKSGVTLLIPYEETYNLMTAPNVKHYTGATAALKTTSTFRKLTMASGATINVSGNICIGGSIATINGGNPSSFPTGPVGMLDMSHGGTINLASGSNLYAWGYVKGQDMDQGNNTVGCGTINVASGGTVWEDYQVGEWRGGTASSTIYNNKSSWKFFPFQSYSVQNVEVPVTYNYGANCKCYWTIFGNGSIYTVSFPLISSSESLFKLASGGTVCKWYDPTTDHVCFELGGTATLDALKLSVMGETVSSADYNLPIPANLKIALKSGNTLTLTKPMTMHAGSVVEVKSGATLNVNSKVYMYDADDWDTYCMYAYYYRTYYSPSIHYNRGEGTSKTNLEDATVIVDGTVNVGAQNLYATAHGASVIGNGGGTLVYNTLPSNTTMIQCKELSDKVSVNIRSANLKNDNDTYTKGTASKTFYNVNGRWFVSGKQTEKSNHTYDFTYIKSGDVYGTGGTNATVSAIWSKDKTGLELTDKWVNVKADACSNWWAGIDDSHLYNWSLNEAWHQYIKTGTIGSGDEEIEVYAGSDGKMLNKKDCDIVEAGSIDDECLYTVDDVKKALVNGSFVAVTANASPDHGYHATADASAYYLCFDGCVWHPATRNAENRYTVDGTVYIRYDGGWLAVQYDSSVALYYSLSATNVKIYYEYINHEWVLATPVAEVVTSAGTEQVYSLATAITKAKAGGTNVTIRLMKDMTLTSVFTYDGTNNCSLDLNGFTLSGSVNNLITVNNASATLILKDQSAESTGKVNMTFSQGSRNYAVYVQNGHFVLNAGTIHAENTNASYASCGVKVNDGKKFTMNGGTLEVRSNGASWGVELASSTTSTVAINGGTIDVKSTGTAPVGIYTCGGTTTMNSGTIRVKTSSSGAIGVHVNNANGKFVMNGGAVCDTASTIAYGIKVSSGKLTMNAGAVTARTTSTERAYGLHLTGTDTINGGTITASATTNAGYGIYANGGTNIVNNATINVSATTNAYGVLSNGGTLTVNNGTCTVNTTSTTNAFGVYAQGGTTTVNEGQFNVTAKTNNAYGIYVTSTTPTCTINGGKYMVKSSDGASTTNAYAHNTAASTNLSLAGGYYNIAPSETYKAAGKEIKDLDATVEASLISAGYTKKIAGAEYTVTWKNRGGAVLKTEKVESGKVPVYSGETPVYSDSWGTYEFNGWAETDKGTKIDPLPAIGASDVTYYAIYRGVYADVTANGTTTRYYSVTTAWTAAMAYKQAYIKVLCSTDNLNQLTFNPTNANSIITLDINGYHWGMNGSKDTDKDCFIYANPSQSNCKLIITDNSASGNGYVHTGWSGKGWPKDAMLHCVKVNAGEVVLENGSIKCRNSKPSQAAVGVRTLTNGSFTMLGGVVEVEKPDSASASRSYGVYVQGAADLAAGVIKATHRHTSDGQAWGINIENSKSASLGEELNVQVTGGRTCYGICSYDTVNINGGTYTIQADTIARGIYVYKSGSYAGYATVSGNPSFTVTARGSAYGASANGAGVQMDIEDGTYDIEASTGNHAYGVTSESSSTVNVKGGEFNVTLGGTTECRGIQASSGSTMNVSGGTVTVNSNVTSNVDLTRCATGDATTLNISGGTFTMAKGGYGLNSFGGTTHVTGNPVFTSPTGVNVASWASAAGTATVVIDGGTFISTSGYALQSFTTYREATGYTVIGDLTVLDGKFQTSGSRSPVHTSCSYTNLKIKGGYFNNTSSKLTVYNAETNTAGCVEAPSTVETLSSGAEYDAGYRYRVNTQYAITWNDGTSNLRVDNLNRNETPSYGSTPVHSGSDTYEFLGWSPAIAPATDNVTYTAQWRKIEAEVYEGESVTPIRFEHFTDAFAYAKNLPVAKLRMLSDVSLSSTIYLNPDSVSGSRPLTLDLNNHTLAYVGSTDADRFLVVNKTGCKLIIQDGSVAKGGTIKYDGSRSAGQIICVATHFGDLELQSGTIYARNSYADKQAWGVYPCRETSFTMTGGNVQAYAKTGARGIFTESTGTPVIEISGGNVLGSTEYAGPTWGNTAYGIRAAKGSKFTISGTANITAHANQDAYAVFAESTSDGIAEITIKGGSVNAIVETKRAFGAYVSSYGKIDIEGGTIDAHSNVADVTSMWNIEGVHCAGNAVLNISGGEITSSNGAGPIGVSVHGGTTTITGGKVTSSVALYAVDYATATQTAIVNVFGGTFIGTAEAVRVDGKVRDSSIKNNANVTVNGGYFYSNSSRLVYLQNDAGAEPSTLTLNGGYYCEKSGTTYKSQITARKSASTRIDDVSVTEDGKTYVYKLSTQFDITWQGGSTYSKVEQVYCGDTPSNNELSGKCFIRNDSAFYFTHWSPTPSPVIGATTYQAEGEYYEAEVKIGSDAWTRYTDFLEAWAVVQENANCSIRLLSNVTLADKIVYRPTVANARMQFDLNNFTLSCGGTATHCLDFNKSDAILTITDNSTEKGGKISLSRDTATAIYTVLVYDGELKLEGGTISSENAKDRVNSSSWWPVIAVYVSTPATAKLTMTGGTIKSQAAYLAYPLYNYGTTNISGGEVIANATGYGYSQGMYAVDGTATISGGTFTITATSNAVGVNATGNINNTGSVCHNGTLNITGGTFNVSATTQNAYGVQSNATGKNIGGTIYTAHGIINVSGGTFNVTCSAATATQIMVAQCNGWRLFDDAVPHTMRAEERSEMNISGGTFTVDTRNNGAWLDNGGNVDLLRSWGTMNVSGGTFTIHQYKGPYAIGVFRGKTTVSGNPVFNVYSHTSNANGVVAGSWTADSYCDKDAANNLAEAEINGGTFRIITEGQNTQGVYALATLSDGGYAMNAKITVNGGTFLTICPNTSGKYPIVLSSREDKVGTYGTAKSEVYVNGGRFMSRKGTEAESTSEGAVNAHNATGKIWLTGGYYETNNQLSARLADTCIIVPITSAEVDPEYANGYRYRIDVDHRVKVTHEAIEKRFLNLNTALEYAKTVANPTITLIGNANFTGPYSLNPTVANWRGTLDLNNFTVTSTTSSDRFLTTSRSDAKLTITDNSGAKGGVWNMEKAYDGSLIGIVVDYGELILAGGKLHVENTTSAKSATGVNVWGTGGQFTQTGGTMEVTSPSGAVGVQMRGAAVMSGGNLTVTSAGNSVAGFTMAADTDNKKYGKLNVSGNPHITVSGNSSVYGINYGIAGDTVTVSGSPVFDITAANSAYGIRAYGANSLATVSGGTFNVTTTSGSGAYVIYLITSAHVNVSGGTFNATSANESAIGIQTDASTEATVSGGTFTCRTAADKQSSFAAYASGGSITITGGTFDASSANGSGNNLNVVRVNKGSTMNISGGTFTGSPTTGNGVCAYGGTTTISGNPVFNTRNGVSAGSWCNNSGSDTWTATVIINGGTFNTSDGYPISAEWYKNGSNILNSDITINGGHFKSTGSRMIYTKAAGEGTATMTINGGYFNEKATGTTYRTQVNNSVASGHEVIDLDTDDEEYIACYRYVVTEEAVAKVKVGSSVTYHPTVASAFTAANAATSASTITMLKDASVTSQLRLGDAGGRNCTLDLNGHTITSTSSEQYPLIVRTSGGSLTITDLTESKLGKLAITTTSTANPYGVYVHTGNLNLDAGTISVSCSTDTIYGIVVKASQTFTMNGGALEVSATNMVGYGVYSSSTATIKNGTVQVAAKGKAYGIARKGGTFTVEGGKFNISSTSATAYATNLKDANANMIIQGGWYTTNNRLATGVAAPYQVLSLAGQSPYLYEVAEAYTLTWTTDGDPLTGSYTSGLTKPGTTITTPNTPTKTGYTFTGWTPAVAATMPAANTEYTATWTRDNYTISYDLAGGSVASANPTSYNVESGAITLNNPTKTNYVFAGWTGTGLAEPTTTVTIPAGSTGNRSYTATWTPAVASVTIGGGTPDYFTTLQEALTFAKGKTDPTVTVLSDISGLTERLEHSGSTSCTLDLNGHTVAGTANALLYINYSSSSTKFIIKNTGGSENGKISLEIAGSSATYCAYVNNGTLQLDEGTIYINSAQTASGAYAVYVKGSKAFTMNGGKLHAVTTTVKAYGVYSLGTTTINSGTIKVESAATGYGIDAAYKTTKIYASAEIDVTGTSAYGVRIGGYSGNANTYNGTLDIYGGTFDVTASNSTAAGVVVYSGTSTKDDVTYHNAGTANISGGTFTVNTTKASKHAYGVYVAAALTDPDATPQATISGGKFKVTAKTSGYAHATNTDAANTALLVQGGWYNVDDNLSGYVAPTKSCNYRVLDLPASELPYKYEVAEAYQLTWNLNSGTVTTAGTCAPVDATGTPSGYVKAGAALTAPVIARDGYTFAAWTPAVAATMPAANTTYTAQWAVASVTTNDVTTLYTDINAAWTAVTSATAASTLTLLQNVSVTSQLTYDNAQNCTLDLNGHAISYTGSDNIFLTINRTGSKLIMTDNSIAKGGKLKFDGSCSNAFKLVYIQSGEFELQNDTLFARNSNGNNSATGVYVERSHNARFTMTGGAVEAIQGVGSDAYAVRTLGLTNITGGVIKASSATSNAFGILSEADTLNIGGSVSVYATVAVSTVAALRVDGLTSVCYITGGTYHVNQTTTGSSKWNLECIRMNADAKKCHITGGTFTATHAGNEGTYAVRIRGGELIIDDAVFNADYGIYKDNSDGVKTSSITVNGGTFNCTGSYGIQILNADNVLSITGGKFNCTNAIFAWTQYGTIDITGGWYSNNTYNLASYVSAPKHVMPTTAADKASQGEEYNYKVVDAYTLTWTTDGDELTGDYTSGYLEPGTPIVAPNNPTKTNYTFNGWTPAVAATMPSANTTYTATWNAEVATVTINGTTTSYASLGEAFAAANAATSAPTIRLLANAALASSLTYSGSYNATLDLNNHTVSGTVDKLLNINASGKTFTITDSSDDKGGELRTVVAANARIYCAYITAGTLIMDEGKIYAQNTYTYNGSTAKDVAATAIYVSTLQTLIVNGGTVESEAQYGSYAIYGVYGADKEDPTNITVNGGLVYGHTNSSSYATGIYTEAKGLTINDGTIKAVARSNNARSVYINGGGRGVINGGTIEAIVDTTYGSATSYGIYTAWQKVGGESVLSIPSTSTVTVSAVAKNTSAALYLGGGTKDTIQAGTYNARTKTGANAYGIFSTASRAKVTGGTFNVTSATTNAYGVYAGRDQIAITGNPVFNVTGTSECAGICAYSVTPASGYFGTATVSGGTFKVNATSNAYGVQAIGNTVNNGATDYAYAGVITVSDGTFEVNSTNAIGIKVGPQVTLGSANASPKITTTGGKFKTTGTGAIATNTDATTDNNIIQGGWYTANDNLADYVASPYHVIDLEDESPYIYEVAEAYTLTWTTDGDALTGDYTKGVTKVGTTIVAPNTPTKSGYVFAGWTPDVAATMPASNTTYTATWTAAVAEVTSNGETTPYVTFDAAWTAANTATAASTLTLLQNVSVTSQLIYDNAQNCTLDLNGHTITSTTAFQSPLHIYASCTFTITDGSVGKSGKLSMTSTCSDKTVIFGAYVQNGDLVLEAGTIEVISSTKTTCGVSATGTFTMNGGTIHVVTTNGQEGRGLYFNGTMTINDGTIHVEAAGVGSAMKREKGGAITVNGGKFNINGATANINHTESVSGGLTIHGGWYNTSNRLNPNTPYHVFDLADESPYLYEVAEAYQLTWNLNGGTVTTAGTSAPVDATGTLSGYVKPGASITAPVIARDGYTFASWSPAVAATMPSSNTTYTAQWAVASVTTNDVTTLYTNMTDAWTAVNNATAETTLKLLQDISTSSTGAKMLYENTQNCTLDLNGHTINMTNTSKQSPLHINRSGISFTITDGTVDKSGKLSMTSSFSTSAVFGAYVENGTLVLEAGTIEVISGTQTTCGVSALTTGTFTMNGGTIHVVATDGQIGRGLYFNGTMTVNSGTIHVEAAGDGYGINRDSSGGTATVYGGKFNITSSSGTPSITNQANNTYVKIYGGYYNINTQLGTCVTAPYHVLDLTSGAEYDEGYRYKVAEAYTIRFLNGESVLQTGVVEAGTTPVYSGATPTKADDDDYSYTFNSWSPAIATVAAAQDYSAQYDSTYLQSGSLLDIVDYPSADSVTINMNGCTWKVSADMGETYKEKGSRYGDRTMVVGLGSEPNPGDQIHLIARSADGTLQSHRSYTWPYIYDSSSPTLTDIPVSYFSDPEQSTFYVRRGMVGIYGGDIHIRKLIVCPGATVVAACAVTIDTLIIRTLPWQAGEIVTFGEAGSFSATKTFYTRIAPNNGPTFKTITDIEGNSTDYVAAKYYQLGLPRTCTTTLSGVLLSNGKTPSYGNEWLMKKYDESSRANNGTSNSNWEALAGSATLQGGAGYEIFSNSTYYREFYFPVGATSSASMAESVAVSYTADGKAGDGNKGWNVVVSPLMSTYVQNDEETEPEDMVKIGMLLADGSYEQDVFDEIPAAIPFTVQAKESGKVLTFAEDGCLAFSNPASPAPSRNMTAEEQAATQWLRVKIEDENGRSDKTNIYTHPTRYENTYKPGIDVEKQSFTASRALIYSSHAYGEMAFAGVSDSILERGLPLTFYSPAEQQLTISLRPSRWLSRLAYVWLTDNETGVRTDLLLTGYTFTATEGTTAGRFIIEGRYEAPQVATDIDDLPNGYRIYNEGGNIAIHGVEPGTMVYIYDAVGKMMYRAQATDEDIEIPAPCQGVYLLHIGEQTAKMIIK